MITIQESFRTDAAAVAKSLALLGDLAPRAAKAPDLTLAMFDELARCSTLTDAPRERSYALSVCAVINLLAKRYASWAFTDLLRGRITAALGYGRLQAEAVGLSFLVAANPGIAGEWTAAVKETDGRKFYKKYQGRVMTYVREAHLDRAYDRGSNESLHVRITPVLRAHHIDRSGGGVRMSLKDRETRDEDPFDFLDSAVFLFCLEVDVLAGLSKALGATVNVDWNKSLAVFGLAMSDINHAMISKYSGRYSEESLRDSGFMK